MFRCKQDSGFILPIIVLLMAVLSLTWSLGLHPQVGEGELQESKRLEAELLFWHKALVAFAFTHERGFHNFRELLQFYDLANPDYQREDGEVVTFSNWPTLENVVELNIDNLPDSVVQHYLQSYPLGLRSNRGNGLIFPAVPIEQWDFTKSLIRRAPQESNYMAVDLDLAGRDVAAVSAAYAGNVSATSAVFANHSRHSRISGSSVQSAKLNFADAIVADVNVNALVAQLLSLEAQLGPCLAVNGPCHN